MLTYTVLRWTCASSSCSSRSHHWSIGNNSLFPDSDRLGNHLLLEFPSFDDWLFYFITVLDRLGVFLMHERLGLGASCSLSLFFFNKSLMLLLDKGLMLFVDNWLMNLVDVFLLNRWIDCLMNNGLVMLVYNLFSVLVNDIFVMFMNHILMCLCDNWCGIMSFNDGLFIVLLVFSTTFMSLNSCPFMMADNNRLLSSLNNLRSRSLLNQELLLDWLCSHIFDKDLLPYVCDRT